MVAEEIEELQREVNLEDPALNMQCQDYDCCKYEADLSPTHGDMSGGVVPEDEKRCTRHLLYHTVFGKALLHKLVLRAADMPTKGTTTSLQKHFSEQFVNEAIRTYTKVLLAGGKPTFPLLIQMTPPQNFQTWKPD